MIAPVTAQWLCVLATIWAEGVLWMAHRARTEALIRRCGGRHVR